MQYEDLSIKWKLLIGFISITFLVLVAGGVGIGSSKIISNNADNILYNKVPLKDASMKATISLIKGRDAAAEYVLATENLDKKGSEFKESNDDFHMWISSIKYGAESPDHEHKNNQAGARYADHKIDIVIPKGSPEEIKLVMEAEEFHQDFEKNAIALMETHKSLLKYNVFEDGKQINIDNWILQKEIDHLRWVEQMSIAIAQDNDFSVELDPTKCSFGKWYYSYNVDDPELMEILRKAEQPHRELHNLGKKINAISDKSQRQFVFDQEVLPVLNEMKTVFEEFRDYTEPIIAEKNSQKITHMKNLDKAAMGAEEKLGQLQELADLDMIEAIKKSDIAEKRANLLLIGTILGSGFLTIGIGSDLTRKIAGPLKDLTIDAKLITEGKIFHKITIFKSRDEIGVLSKALHRMSKKLQFDIVELQKKEGQLKSAYKDLESIDQLKSDIISNVSHELKTPLTIIKGCLELALEEDDPEETHDYLNTSLEALDRQESIINNLLAVSGIGKISSSLKLGNIEEIIENELRKKTADFDKKTIIYETLVEKNLPLVQVNRKRIEHLLSNLIDNSIKFNRANGKVQIMVRKVEGFIEVSISDTGIGIEKEKMENIYKPLTQLDPSTKRYYSGTGSGLTAAKIIVESHGGKIWAESKHGEGTTFYFTLPVE